MRRHTEQWLAAVFAAPTSARARDAAYAMSTFADWDTGENCWAGAVTLAAKVRRGRRTIQRGIEELEALRFIERTGITRPHNATDYALVTPDPTSAKVGATTSAKVGATDMDQLRQFGQSVAPNQAISSAKVGAQPPQTSSDRRDEEEEDEAPVPTPQCQHEPLEVPDARAKAHHLAVEITRRLRQHWRTPTFTANKAHTRQLRKLIEQGWEEHQIIAAVNTIGTNARSHTNLLTAHLSRMQEWPPGDYETLEIEAALLHTEIDRHRETEEELAHLTCAHGVRLALLEIDLSNCWQCHTSGQVQVAGG